MTREQAVKILEQFVADNYENDFEFMGQDEVSALKIAIKALTSAIQEERG